MRVLRHLDYLGGLMATLGPARFRSAAERQCNSYAALAAGHSPPLKHPTRWALTSIPRAVAELILLPRPKVFRSSSLKELRSSNQNEQLSLLTGKKELQRLENLLALSSAEDTGRT